MAAIDKGDVVILGAGLVGSLLAYVLQRHGYQVTVYERYQDIRHIPSLGRSINLVITKRGLRATEAIGEGLKAEMLSLAVPVKGRVIHQADGTQQYQPYGKDDSECNYSISRFELNKFLIGKAEAAGARMLFNCELNSELTRFDEGSSDVGCTLAFKNGDIVTCGCPVIACDGGGSRARSSMVNQGLTQATETLLGVDETGAGVRHGYKEILFPRDSGLSLDGLHIWPRSKHMLMALANLDGSMTGTLYMDETGSSESFAALTTPDDVQTFLETHYRDAIGMIGGAERAVEQMIKNPSGLLGTVRTSVWNCRGRVVLMGDASHAIVPFFGQGMNSGFEDVLELTTIMAKHMCVGGQKDGQTSASDGAKWREAFEEFATTRKPNTDAIADMALENFEEMRHKVGSRTFLLRKKIENRIENSLGDSFRSGYSMVCYGGGGNVSYRNAYVLSRIQNEILQDLSRPFEAELEAISDDSWPEAVDRMASQVSLDQAESMIQEKLVPLHKELHIDLSTVSNH